MIPPPRVLRSKTKRREGDSKLTLRVHLQDRSFRVVNTYRRNTGYDLLLQCAEELGCEAPQYFNLCRPSVSGVDSWLDLNLTLESLGLEDGDSVHFKIKYFKVPSYKLDAVSLQLFFLQTKDSILSGKFHVPERLAILLAAFQLQVFYGTYDPDATWLAGLASNLSEFLPIEHATTGDLGQWARRIIHYYQYLYDMSASDATYGYLTVARRVPACGAFLFPVMQGKLHVTIGIVEDGVLFFKDDKKSKFEFVSFDDLLAWANTDGGVALRLQKRSITLPLPSSPLFPSSPPIPSPSPSPPPPSIAQSSTVMGDGVAITSADSSSLPSADEKITSKSLSIPILTSDGAIRSSPTVSPSPSASDRNSAQFSSPPLSPSPSSPPTSGSNVSASVVGNQGATHPTPNTDEEAEYFQMRVNYDCTSEQALTIIDLLEGYNWLLSRKSQERTRMLISEGLSPVASPAAYMKPSRRAQDEPFGSKLDHFLHCYNRSCHSQHTRALSQLLHRFDQLDFPGRMHTIDIGSTNLEREGSLALLNALTLSQRYKSYIGDRTVTHNFEPVCINVERNRVSPEFAQVSSVCPSLTSLNLSFNSFTKDDGNALINAFKAASNLVELNLSDNDLGDRTLSSLVPALSRCTHLRKLNLAATSIKLPATCAEVGKLVGGLFNFEKLSLQRNKLSDACIDAFIVALESALTPPNARAGSPPNSAGTEKPTLASSSAVMGTSSSNLNTQTNVGLNGSRIPTQSVNVDQMTNFPISGASGALGEVTWDYNMKFASAIPRGYHLDFRNVGMSSKGLVQIASFIKRFKLIRTLRIAGNSISSASSLVDAMKEDVKMLILDVGEANFGKKGWIELFVALARQQDSSRFDSTQGLEKYGWSSLRMYMRDVMTRVSHLEFKNCDFTSSSQVISSLTDILGHPQCFVTKLVLKGSNFGKKDFVPFADVLANSAPTLMHLDLSRCKLDHSASAYIGRALKSNFSLMELVLDANSFTNFAVKEFAEALTLNSTLQLLSIKRNALTADCLPLWLHCVTINSSLQILDLRQNSILIDIPSRALLRSVPCATQIII